MQHIVRMSSEAEADLNNITYYLEDLTGGQKASENFRIELEKNVRLIAFEPRLFGYSRLKELKEKGYRSFLVKGYIALYIIDNEEVTITNIFHQSQDYARLI